MKLDPAIAKKVHALGEESVAIFRDAVAAFFKKDAQASNDAIDRAQALHAKKRALVHEVMDLKGPSAVALAYILESMERTASYGADIGEIAINHIVVASGE